MASRLLFFSRYRPFISTRPSLGFSTYHRYPLTPNQWPRLPSLSALALVATSFISCYIYHFYRDSRWLSSISMDTPLSSPQIPTIRLSVAAACEPKHSFNGRIGINCGDDAYIVAHRENRVLLAVADGVGGSREGNVDPGKYAWSLLSGIGKLFSWNDQLFEAQRVLAEEYAKAIDQAEHQKASSTVCLADIDTVTSTLHLYNIGDSGCRIIRNGRIIYRSPVGQFDFNFPHQLSVVDRDEPVSVRQFAIDTVNRYMSNDNVSLKADDLVIVATDGVFDNLYENQILDWIKEHDQLDIQTMTTEFARHVRRESEKKSGDSPFSQAARSKRFRWHGG
jgi:protein phosphatase PTC7